MPSGLLPISLLADSFSVQRPGAPHLMVKVCSMKMDIHIFLLQPTLQLSVMTQHLHMKSDISLKMVCAVCMVRIVKTFITTSLFITSLTCTPKSQQTLMLKACSRVSTCSVQVSVSVRRMLRSWHLVLQSTGLPKHKNFSRRIGVSVQMSGLLLHGMNFAAMA